MNRTCRGIAAALTLFALAASSTAEATPVTVLTDPAGDVHVQGSAGMVGVTSPRIDILSLDMESTATDLIFTIHLDDIGAPSPLVVGAAGPLESVEYAISFQVHGTYINVSAHTSPGDTAAWFRVEWADRELVDYCTRLVPGAIDAAADTVTATIPYTAFTACGFTPVDATTPISDVRTQAHDRIEKSVYEDFAY